MEYSDRLIMLLKGYNAMTQLEFVLNEIKSNGNLTKAEESTLEKILNEHHSRMLVRHPFYDLFITGTGQSYGLAIQEKIIESFNDLTEHKGSSDYDADCFDTKEKIEIKSVKALTKGKKDKNKEEDDDSEVAYIGERIINYTEQNTKCGGSFQQVKPTACDWFILHILFGNYERLFLVPSKVVSGHPGVENAEPNKIPLSIQHRNHKTEGQINIGQIFNLSQYFEIKGYTHKISKKYSFKELKKDITTRLNAIDNKLPIEVRSTKKKKKK